MEEIPYLDRLPITEKLILEIITLGYKGLSFKRILNYYIEYSNVNSIEKVEKERIKEIIKDFLDKEVIVEDHKLNYLCNPILQKRIFLDFVVTKRFSILSNIIKYDTINNKKIIEEEDVYCLSRILLFRGNSDLNSSLNFKDLSLRNTSLELILENIIDDIIECFDIDFIDKSLIHESYKNKIYYHILHKYLNGSDLDYKKVEYIAVKIDSLDSNTIGLLNCIYFINNHESYNILQNKYFKEIDIHFEIWSKLVLKNESISYRQDKTFLKKDPKKNIFRDYKSLLYFLHLIKEGNSDNYSKALIYVNYLANFETHPFIYEIRACKDFLDYIVSEDDLKPIFDSNLIKSNNYWSILFYLLLSYWAEVSINEKNLDYIENYAEKINTTGNQWFYIQIQSILQKFSNPNYDNTKDIFFLKDIYTGLEKWERALKVLKEFTIKKQSSSKYRIIWEIKYSDEIQYIESITPFEQILSQSGEWITQREISLKSLYISPEKYAYLSTTDLQIIQNSKREINDISGSYTYSLNLESLEYLVDKPNIYDQDTKMNVSIKKKSPQLLIIRNSNHSTNLKLFPLSQSSNSIILKETENRLTLYTFSDDLLKIQEVVGKSGVTIPEKGEKDLSAILSDLSEYITIQSEIESTESLTSMEIKSENNLFIEIIPFLQGISIQIHSKPFGKKGESFIPFSGGINVYSNMDEKNILVRRDFKTERDIYNSIISNCSTLSKFDKKSEFHFFSNNSELALELISELNDLKQNIILEFPQGNKYSVLGKINEDNFRLFLHRYKDYYRLSGVIELDTGNSYDIEIILSRLSNSIGRFLLVNENDYVSISPTLKNTLIKIKSLSIVNSSEIFFSPIMIYILKDLFSKFKFLNFDKNWESINQDYYVSQKFIPKLHSNFKAQLRSYQLEGFIWMMKLFKFGAGVCLADDMGLGKTIQALSVVRYFAEEGPTLIITPTSVISNWASEINKNCTGVRIKFIEGSNREKSILLLKERDILICSYGLLQQNEVSSLLSKKKWKTIVLDEAQKIKNIQTKRSLAIMNLKADIRLATTGTPIENHLSELWNLFNFLNPTLLGTKEKYKKEYILPIKKENNINILQNLKSIVSPFILRRLKKDVLPELPSKTEIILEVDLSDSEKKFYESLRNDALSTLSDPLIPLHKKQIQILAELMKLRRACCNTKLIDKNSTISSSKFNLFTKIVRDLLENKHRALIFSQFVDHLAIAKEYMLAKKIPFQYLDGSSSNKERAKSVELFQSGVGEVFLISLRAGGTGLNLTSADYVIHLDPWWNPAIEDQASDRVYRYGQTKPVTIYKFITKDTIEERIYSLHAQKRELANFLLNDGREASSLSIEELFQLIESTKD